MTERNNLERINLPDEEVEEVSSSPQKPQQKGLDFWSQSTTEFVTLPSEGKLYPSNHPFASGKAEIKMMVAYHEDILANKDYIREGVLFDKFIKAICAEDVDPESLLNGDRKAILLQARNSAYGSTFKATAMCSVCKTQNKIEANIDINSERNSLHINQGFLSDEMKELYNAKLNSEGNLVFSLPQTGVTVENRISTGEMEKKIYQHSMWRKKQGMPELGITDQMKMVILSANGEDDKTKLENFITNMPARDSRYWREAYKMLQPNVDIIVQQECQGDFCNNVIRQEVGLTPEFFWPKSENI